MYNALCLLADIWNGTSKSTQIFSPTRYIYRESSGCTSLFPADPRKYVSSQIMAEVRQGNMLNWMQELAQSITDALAFQSAHSNVSFPIEASIGFVVADDPAFSLNDYINLADEKMYAEKKEHKATRQ